MRTGGHSDPLQHMNDDHSEELLLVARAFSGHPGATTARAESIDARGMDLVLDTPRGQTSARVEFADPIPETAYPESVRVAFVRLARRARAELASCQRE